MSALKSHISALIEAAEPGLAGGRFSDREDGNESSGAERQDECGFHILTISNGSAGG